MPSGSNECRSWPVVLDPLRDGYCSLGQILDNLLIFLLNVPGWFSHKSVFSSWPDALLTANTLLPSPILVAGQSVGEDQVLERS